MADPCWHSLSTTLQKGFAFAANSQILHPINQDSGSAYCECLQFSFLKIVCSGSLFPSKPSTYPENGFASSSPALLPEVPYPALQTLHKHDLSCNMIAYGVQWVVFRE